MTWLCYPIRAGETLGVLHPASTYSWIFFLRALVTDERLVGMGMAMLCELEVGPAVDVVVLVEDPHRPVDLEARHHQLNDVGWDRAWKIDAIELLEDSGPL